MENLIVEISLGKIILYVAIIVYLAIATYCFFYLNSEGFPKTLSFFLSLAWIVIWAMAKILISIFSLDDGRGKT